MSCRHRWTPGPGTPGTLPGAISVRCRLCGLETWILCPTHEWERKSPFEVSRGPSLKCRRCGETWR